MSSDTISSATNITNTDAFASNDEHDSWFNDIDEGSVEIISPLQLGPLVSPSQPELRLESDLNPDPSLSPDANPHAGMNHPDHMDIDMSEQGPIKSICVDETITKDPAALSSYVVLQCECSIAYFVQVLMEESVSGIKHRTDEDINGLSFEKMTHISEYLQWIYQASLNLSQRIGQETLSYQPDGPPSIVRSSYNFCTKYTQCKNFYSKHETPTCREHHYVHALLCYDVASVIEFLNYVVREQVLITQTELNNLYLSIKTICFVTRHMAKEISYINYITKNNAETFHRSNPIELHRRKFGSKPICSRAGTSYYDSGQGPTHTNSHTHGYSSTRGQRNVSYDTSTNGYRNDRADGAGGRGSGRGRARNNYPTTNRFAILSEN